MKKEANNHGTNANKQRPKNNKKSKASNKSSNKHLNKTSSARNSARAASLKTLKLVFDGQSFSVAQKQWLDELDDPRDRGLANEIVNGVLRWRWQLMFLVSQLLNKPLKDKDQEVQLIILIAVYELIECRTPEYAIINEAVEQVRKSKRKWAASLVNAVLRRFTREKEQLLLLVDDSSSNNVSAYFSHPKWLLKKIKVDWPEHWREILDANNQRPTFWLRVNQSQMTTLAYKKLLEESGLETEVSTLSDSALKLSHGVDVQQLPRFSEGAISVQDAGAQLAAGLLDVSSGQRILDLCAAPGGKTCHILESCDSIKQMVAVELEEVRMQRVKENLQRLRLQNNSSDMDSKVKLIVADACDIDNWWDGKLFDRILIDAPCSATGVIRRHPDIKSLRRESDIEPLVDIQAKILAAGWDMLAKGGELLYVTCSVFKAENECQIENFIQNKNDASEIKINADWGKVCSYGRQLFPGEKDADGFYFCRLRKIK